MAEPQALLVLANLGRTLLPSRATRPFAEPVLPDPGTAAAQLAGVVDQPIVAADLADLRRLQRAASAAAAAILAGRPPDVSTVNALAAASHGRAELAVTTGGAARRVVWTDPTPAAALARRLVDEIGALAPDRLRRCAHPPCDLVFYDTTRSRTRRWHADDPCGWRERQRRARRSGVSGV